MQPCRTPFLSERAVKVSASYLTVFPSGMSENMKVWEWINNVYSIKIHVRSLLLRLQLPRMHNEIRLFIRAFHRLIPMARLSARFLSAVMMWMWDKYILNPKGIRFFLIQTRTPEHKEPCLFFSLFFVHIVFGCQSASGHSEVFQKPMCVNFPVVKEHRATRCAASMHV